MALHIQIAGEHGTEAAADGDAPVVTLRGFGFLEDVTHETYHFNMMAQAPVIKDWQPEIVLRSKLTGNECTFTLDLSQSKVRRGFGVSRDAHFIDAYNDNATRACNARGGAGHFSRRHRSDMVQYILQI